MSYIDQERFRRIVRHARDTNPFYRRFIPDENAVPLLTRRILQEHNDEILNGHPETIRTSGSTGTPVRIHVSEERGRMSRQYLNLGIRHLGGLLPRTQIIHPRGANSAPTLVDVQTPAKHQISILQAAFTSRGAVAIVTYPSNAVLLAQEILDRKLDFGFIRRISLLSETVDPADRRFIASAFPNARFWSTYSSNEFGLISFECPFCPDYHHIAGDLYAVEILDDDDRECPPGRIGRLVLTDYFNFKMPLIRYEIGDLAAFGTCPCGKIALPALQNVLGKARNCLRHRDGRRIPFVDFSYRIRDLPGMRQFQVIQEAMDHFVVKVAASRDLEHELRGLFAAEFGPDVRLDIVPVDTIPREPSGKFYGSICRV
ncbi:MAG TPA: hypothetical protein VHE13_09335 [Opitutus sp.]|nr:hypothetical protein [Opitutus sp.]